MDSPVVRRVLAAALAILGVLLSLLLLWPRPDSAPRTPRAAPVQEVAEARTEAAPVAPEQGHAELIREPPAHELEHPTEKCKMLVEWNDRHVPAWVIEAKMDAQAMKFSDEDMACMEGGGLPDQVLDRAEQNRLRPQPQ